MAIKNVYVYKGTPSDNPCATETLGPNDYQVIMDCPFMTIVDSTSTPTEYYGFALPGTITSAALWRIQRKTVSGSINTYDFADGNANFDNVWDNRVSLSYS